MTELQWLLVAIVASLLMSLGGLARESLGTGSPRAARLAFGAAGLVFVVALALRWSLVRPSFVHANFHAAALVESVLRFPEEASHRRQYGQFSFLALGAVAALCGRSFETLAGANQVFAALTLAALGALAGRYAGRRAAAATVALALLHPALLRIGASEDAHGLALLLGCVALLAMDVHAASGSRWALAAATAALVLMVNTRQTFYVIAPAAYLLALGRGSWRLLRRPAFVGSGLLVVAVLAFRVAATARDGDDLITLRAMPVLLSTPAVIAAVLRFHPLLDAVRFGPIGPVLLLVGLWRCFARAGVTRALAAAFLGVFALTLPFGFPTPGVEFGFRMPALGLGLIVAGVGGGYLLDAAAARARSPRRALAGASIALVAVALCPLTTPSWASARAVAADFEEYRILERIAPTLPPDAALVRLSVHEPMPAYAISGDSLRRAGATVRIVESSQLTPADFARPVLFFAGVQCFGHSLGELAGINSHQPGVVAPDILKRLGPVTFGRELDSPLLLPPRGIRPECAALIEGATPVGPPVLLPHPTQDIPFVIYREDPLVLQLYALRPPP